MSAQPGPIVAEPAPGLASALLHTGYDLAWALALLLTSPWWILRSLVSPVFGSTALERATVRLPEPGDAGRVRVLVHAVSVGEVRAAAPIVRGLAARRPELDVVLSSTTRTGRDLARQLFPDSRVVCFPLDPSWAVGRFLGRVRPALVILVELELWPNFLRACNRRGIPVAVVNGRMTARSFARYARLEPVLPQVRRLSLFCAQREEYRERYLGLGGSPDRVLVTGNTKVDGLRTQTPAADTLAELRRLLALGGDRPVFVAGSTHTGEELLVARAWRAGAPGARLVLVPRYPERAGEVRRDLRGLGLEVQLLSELRGGGAAGAEPDPALPTVVDSIGELDRVYHLADVVFVGGTLVPRGGQNVLEPAAAGKAVIHGPGILNFAQEAALLEGAGASMCVASGDELALALRELLSDAEARERMGAAGLGVVAGQRGAARITVEALEERFLGRLPAGAGGAVLAPR